MDNFDDIISEIASATMSPNPIIGQRSRRQAIRAAEPRDHAPAAPTEIASATTLQEPVFLPRSRRQATRLAAPTLEPPAAPIDEADTPSEPASLTPRRRQAMQAEEPTDPSPAAPHPELASAKQRLKPTSTERPRRQAIRSSDPEEATPAAPNSDGHVMAETQCSVAIGSDHGARSTRDTQQITSPVVAQIVQGWRMRQRWHRAEKALTLQGLAFCRAYVGGDKAEAQALFKRAHDGDAPPDLMLGLLPFLKAIENFEPERKQIEKTLKALARELPVFTWSSTIKGFGELNLAALVGEAGDIGSYRSPAAFWKRMGLAVIRGERQRKVADEEKALEHGYNPRRRAVAYLLGETLIKTGGDESPYRAVYLERKEYELAREDDGKPRSQLHAHKRAARYMCKRALRDLWSAWRRATVAPLSRPSQPAADIVTAVQLSTPGRATRSRRQAIKAEGTSPPLPAAPNASATGRPEPIGRLHSRRQAILASQPGAPMPAAPIDEAIRVSKPTFPAPRRRQATHGTQPSLLSPAAPITEIASSTAASGPNGRARSQRQAKGRAEPETPAPAAPIVTAVRRPSPEKGERSRRRAVLSPEPVCSAPAAPIPEAAH